MLLLLFSTLHVLLTLVPHLWVRFEKKSTKHQSGDVN